MEKSIPNIPKKPFKPRTLIQNPSNPPRIHQNSPQFQPVPLNNYYPQPYSEPSPPRSEELNQYKRPLSIASLLYPSLNLDSIRQILIDSNLTLNDQSLEKLSSLFKANDSSLHPFHLTDLEISTFKSIECTKKDLCPDTYCQFFHYLGEKRRVPVHYSEYLCPKYSNCPKGDACELAHNRIEQAYHPRRIMEFYQEMGEFYKNEEVYIEGMNLQQLEGLKAKKLKEKVNIIKDIENRLIYLGQLKKKFLCVECRKENARVVTVPCGHLLCDGCREDRFCAHCKIDCTFYLIKKN